MRVPLRKSDGEEIRTLEILTAWDRRPLVPALLHQAVTTAAANARIPWAHTKNRGEVRGGGRKPWKQKGTGRARHGSIRSPLWKGGGVVFGPRKEETFAKRMPVAMRRAALAMALVGKARDSELRLVEAFPQTGKTKPFAAFLGTLGVKASALVVPAPEERQAVMRAVRNLARVFVADASALTAADVLKSHDLLVTPRGWSVIERRLEKRRRKELPSDSSS